MRLEEPESGRGEDREAGRKPAALEDGDRLRTAEPRGLGRFFERFLGGDGETFAEIETFRKVALIYVLATVALGSLIPYAVYYTLTGAWLWGIVEFGVTAAILACVLHVRLTRRPELAAYISTLVISLFLLLLLARGGPAQAFWAHTYPLAALFFLGPRRGTVALLAFLGAVVLFFVLDPGEPFLRYPMGFKTRFLGSFAVIGVVAYVYELIRIRIQSRIEAKNRALANALRELEATAQALGESELKYRDMVERAGDGIAVVQDRRIQVANPHLAAITGWRLEELQDQPFARFVHPDELGKMVSHHEARLRGEPAPSRYESALLHKSGDRVEVEISTGVVPLNGKPATMAFIRDVSEKKRAAREHNLLQERVRHSQKMEAIGELAGGVAHDFNNMLSAISGFAELLWKNLEEADARLAGYAETIVSTSNRAAELTAKLLAFARRGAMTRERTSVHQAVRDVVKLLERTIDPRVEIDARLEAHADCVLGDRAQVQNSILNLAVNARDAMPEGGVVTFETQNLDLEGEENLLGLESGKYLRLAVTDTGAGMDEETRRRAFEPFFTTKEMGKGTGLGLASVYGTVKAHGGTVEVHSKKGAGSTFSVYLPVTPSVAPEAAPEPMPASPVPGRVLVIDDEPAVREMLGAMLEEIGLGCVLGRDGEEGVAIFRDLHPEIDLVIVDLMMPKLGGAECIAKLKEIDPEVRAIVTSGYALNDDARRSLDAGACAFLQKPYSLMELSRTLAPHMGRMKTREEAPVA